MAIQNQAQAMGVAPVATGNPGDLDQGQGLGGMLQGLLQSRQKIDQAIATTLPSAVTPTSAPGVTQGHVPGALSFGVGQPKLPPPQGHNDARNQGIAKTVAGVANIVGSVIKAKDAEKQRTLAVDIERVMKAQDGISQATAQLKADPSNKELQDTVAKNKQIINDTIGADPKKLKQFEKAFDVNFMKPEENTGVEHDARKMATKSYADQLAAKTPETLAPNQAAQQKLQILGAQGTAVDSQIKAIMPAYNQQQKDISAAQRVAGQQAHADARTDATNATRAAIAEAANKTREDAIEANKQIANLRSKTAYGVQAMRQNAEMDRTLKIIDSRRKIADKNRASKPSVAGKIDEQNAALISKQLSNLPQLISSTETARDKADPSQKDGYDKTIQMYEKQQKMWSAMLTQYSQENMNMPPEEKGASSDGKSESKPISVSAAGNAADDTEDEDGDSTDPDYY
jgi:hypothetical protein